MIFIATDILNPYKREILSQDSYNTLIDFLVEKFPDGFKRPTDISVNGHEVALADYDIQLKENDVIVLLDRAALPVGLIGGWFITALANLAISVTLSYVANKLFAPDAPDEQGSPSSVYNLNSAQNAARFGSPIPIVYGKVRMFPSMIVQPFYRFEDNVEFLYHVLCVGQGTMNTDEVLIGDDLVTNVGDFDWKLLYRDSFYNIPSRGYGYHITKTLTVPSTVELKGKDGSIIGDETEKYKISADASKVEFDYMYPNGLYWVDTDEYKAENSEFKFTVYTESAGVYTQVYSKSFFRNELTTDAIQETFTYDISQHSVPVYVSFQRTIDRDVTNVNPAGQLYIKRVKEIYPNEDFTQLYGDITLLVCKIKATNTVSAAGQVKINGYFTRTDVGNNMAQVLTDIYTNTNYGGGLNIDDLSFPITNETVNCAYDSSMTIFDAMRRPALAQGYSLYLAGMDVILKKDGINAVTSAMYNEMNIIRDSFKAQYLFKEEYPAYDGFKCTYIDGNGWVQRAATYPANSTRPKTVDLFGVVDYGQVYEAPVSSSGWYTITINSDTYGDYDISTLAYTGGSFFGNNPSSVTLDSNLDLATTGYYLNFVFKSNALSSSNLVADRNALDTTDGNYRCQFTWDKATRTWNRTDAPDYYLYPINQEASYSHSLGVCTSDPRFLVHIYDTTITFNTSGIFPDYPKTGIIWLNDGETVGGI